MAFFRNKLIKRLKLYIHKVKRRQRSNDYIELKEINDNYNTPVCVFRDFNNYFTLKAYEVLNNDHLLYKLDPKAILLIKNIHDKCKIPENFMYIKSSKKNGEYKIMTPQGWCFNLNRDSICENNDILKNLPFEDAFKIIYETAYNNALHDFQSKNIPKYKTDNSTHLQLID